MRSSVKKNQTTCISLHRLALVDTIDSVDHVFARVPLTLSMSASC